MQAEDLAFGTREDAADDAHLAADLRLLVEQGQRRVRAQLQEVGDHLGGDLHRAAALGDEVQDAARAADRGRQFGRVEAQEEVAGEERFDHDLVLVVPAPGPAYPRQDHFDVAERP